MIREGGLTGGDVLPSEAELAIVHGVSARVVRDALRTLSNLGVIETRQGRRAAVRDLAPVAIENYFRYIVELDREAILELFDTRLAIETKAASLAAERASADDIAAMYAALARMADAGDDHDTRTAANLEYHAAIIRAAKNRFFSGIIEALSEILRTERLAGSQLRASAGQPGDLTISEHGEILEAIRLARPKLAETLMHDHLAHIRDSYEALFPPDGRLRRSNDA